MGFLRRWFALRRAKKEEKRHLLSEDELKEHEREFKGEIEELEKVIQKGRKKNRKKPAGKKQPTKGRHRKRQT
ncbi:hypothetical protein JXB31_01795 [Candidatus Woesearchaeota archaeon]|nr:hypothetical protein [Candidatus Woesearchaeota archaeon]